MKHELLILISTLPCCLLFANVGIQLRTELVTSQPNVSESPTESTEEILSTLQSGKVYDENAFFRVPIQLNPSDVVVSSVGQGRSADDVITHNETHHKLPPFEVPYSYSADQQKLHDLIFENSKNVNHSSGFKCEGEKCKEKKINDVDLSSTEIDRENFKHPTVVNIHKGSIPFHQKNLSDSATSHKPSNTSQSHPLQVVDSPYIDFSKPEEHPLPAEDFPEGNSTSVDKAPTGDLPAEEFPYANSTPVDKVPNRFYPVPFTKSLDNSTPQPTSGHQDGEQSYSVKNIVITVLACSLFGALCYIMYGVYTERIRSCRRRQRQILVEEFDEEDGTRMEMNPRNEENDEENSPL